MLVKGATGVPWLATFRALLWLMLGGIPPSINVWGVINGSMQNCGISTAYTYENTTVLYSSEYSQWGAIIMPSNFVLMTWCKRKRTGNSSAWQWSYISLASSHQYDMPYSTAEYKFKFKFHKTPHITLSRATYGTPVERIWEKRTAL